MSGSCLYVQIDKERSILSKGGVRMHHHLVASPGAERHVMGVGTGFEDLTRSTSGITFATDRQAWTMVRRSKMYTFTRVRIELFRQLVIGRRSLVRVSE